MISHRTTARGAVLLLTLAAAVAAATTAPAAQKPIVFPLLSDVPVYDNYGDPRPNGRHAGIDIEGAPRRTAVLAAENGRIEYHTTAARAGCMLYLYGASGTTYLYIHLNNDVTLRNDNKGRCELGTAYTVKDGAKVTAGEQIALNGDSGDADGNPHLHFEVHPNDGADVNPLPYLTKAERLLFPGRLGSRFALGLRGVTLGTSTTTLTVRVHAVRWWPGGRWTPLERVVTLSAPPGSTGAEQGTRSGASRSDADDLTVFTTPAQVTAKALRGEDGVLRASRIVKPDGTVVDLESTITDDDSTFIDPNGPRPY
jgi:peptidase M23-like protein